MTKNLSPNKSRARIGGLILIGTGFLLIDIISGIILLKSSNVTGSAASADGSLTIGGSVVPIEVNFTVPTFSLIDLQGRDVSLDDYRGKVILINNWATWCPPCKAEMSILEAYYRYIKSKDSF